MSAGWESSVLGEVFDVRDGTHDSPKYEESGYALITSKNLKDSELNFDKVRYISENDYRNINKRSKVDEGDVLLAMIGTIGNPVLVVEEPNYAIKNVALFKVPQNQSGGFLKYYLESNLVKKKMLREAKGSTQKFVGLRYLREFPISIPTLSEQTRIVAILDEAFESMAEAQKTTKRNLANAQELFDSYLNGVFSAHEKSAPMKLLKEVSVEFGRGKSKHRPRNDPSLYGGKYPFIQTGDVRNAIHEIREYKQTYNEKGLAQSKLWPKGTICITIAANIAETGVLGFDACFPDSLIGIVVDENNISGKYIEYSLQSVKSRLQARGKGSAQSNINLKTFETELFAIPSFKVQCASTRKLDKMLSSTYLLKERLVTATDFQKELKLAILQKAFSGELTKNSDKVLNELGA